jgi:hypothetical protein
MALGALILCPTLNLTVLPKLLYIMNHTIHQPLGSGLLLTYTKSLSMHNNLVLFICRCYTSLTLNHAFTYCHLGRLLIIWLNDIHGNNHKNLHVITKHVDNLYTRHFYFIACKEVRKCVIVSIKF